MAALAVPAATNMPAASREENFIVDGCVVVDAPAQEVIYWLSETSGDAVNASVNGSIFEESERLRTVGCVPNCSK